MPHAPQVVADREARVGQELMMAAGVTGIPCALVVDRQGIVRFVGHPAEPAFEAAIRQVACIHDVRRIACALCMCVFRPGEAQCKCLKQQQSSEQALCGNHSSRHSSFQ